MLREINFEEFERQLLVLYRIEEFGIDPTARQENELASDAQRAVRPPGPMPQSVTTA